MHHSSFASHGHWSVEVTAELPTRSPAVVLSPLERACVETVAYADVFDCALTESELHRYLVGVEADRVAVRTALASDRVAGGFLWRSGGYVTLAGREQLVERRRECAEHGARLWPEAVRYGALLARFPFVRLVAVSGALAVDNAGVNGDIDFFIVTEPDRLWLCRGLVIGVVRWAARRGVTLCPNYFLSERMLALDPPSLFAAHEVTQMVPVGHTGTYRRFRRLNRWTDRFLPNAAGAPRVIAARSNRHSCWSLAAEWAGRTSWGGRVERWEQTRKIGRLSRRARGHDEARFSAEWCKGHFGRYGDRVRLGLRERLHALQLLPDATE